MRIGVKFKKGYQMLEAGQWAGIFLVYEAATNLYQLDAIDELIYEKLTGYIRAADMTGSDTEANQWIKIFLMDSRYAGLLLKAGNLLDNMTEVFNMLPEIPDDIITDLFIEGRISKVKYVEDSFFYIEKDITGKQTFLMRRHEGESVPVDFDVDDFRVNRQEKTVEFNYVRGLTTTLSVDCHGENKKHITE